LGASLKLYLFLNMY